MYKCIFSIIGFLLVFSACDKSSNPKTEEPTPDHPLKSAVVEQNNNFSFDIFQEIVSNESENANIFISPLSMYYALAMTGTGSDTETKSEFDQLLGWTDMTESEILEAMKELTKDLKPVNDNVTFTIANSIWQKQGAPVKEAFKSQSQDYFDAEVRELDFSSPEAVEIINSWIEVKTNNLIQDMLDFIPPDAFMYLINAIYFKADWSSKFDVEDSFEGEFVAANNNTVNTTFMIQKSNFEYSSNNMMQAIKLPYTDTTFSMHVLLPQSNYSASDIVSELNEENWKTWNSNYTMQEVTLTLPRFKLEYGVKLINDELQSLGLQKAFTPGADFSKITDASIYISRVMHKAFIEVNEEGSEAAAATIVEMVETSAGNELHFTANKPFVFTICHEPSNSILFMGILADPS